jgi:hypothetical protein
MEPGRRDQQRVDAGVQETQVGEERLMTNVDDCTDLLWSGYGRPGSKSLHRRRG